MYQYIKCGGCIENKSIKFRSLSIDLIHKSVVTITNLLICLGTITAQNSVIPKLILPVGHDSNIDYVAFDSSGRKVLTSSYNKAAKIWDSESGLLVHKFDADYVRFSPKGDLLLIYGNSDSCLLIVDTDSGEISNTFCDFHSTINDAKFSPLGDLLVLEFEDKSFEIFQIKSGKPLFRLDGNNPRIVSTTFDHNGNRLLITREDQSATIIDSKTGIEIKKLIGHASTIYGASFSRVDDKIVTLSDGSADIVDLNSGLIIFNLPNDIWSTRFACFSPNGDLVLTTSHSGARIIWSVISGAPLDTLRPYHINARWNDEYLDGEVAASFSPDGSLVVSASDDGLVFVSDTRSGELLWELEGFTNDEGFQFAFSQDGRFLVTACKTIAKKWDLRNGKMVQIYKGFTSKINSACMNHSDNTLLTVTSDGEAGTWDLRKGIITNNLRVGKGVLSCSYSPSGLELLTTYIYGVFKIWSIKEGVVRRKVFSVWPRDASGEYMVFDGNFNTNGKNVITSSEDNSARVWDVMVESKDDELWFLDPDNQTLLNDLKHSSSVFSAKYNLKGDRIITTTWDTVKIWDANNGHLINNLVVNRLNTHSAEFNLDGKLVVASGDSTVLIWNVYNDSLHKQIIGIKSKVLHAIFTINDDQIIIINEDNLLTYLALSTEKIIKAYKFVGQVLLVDPRANILITQSNTLLYYYDLQSGRQLYSFLSVGGTDYLVLHPDGYYDGTEAARNLLYFVCNGEIIDLAQMKDALYVPGLVEKIMTGQEINYDKLTELDICDALPIVNKLDGKEYTYTITPRRLPLERAEVYVNDKLIFSYPVDQLSFIDNNYELELEENELDKHLQVGENNRVKVIGVVKSEKGSELRTRGITEPIEKKTKGEVVPPRLFAVMIGINDYKDPSLRLNYPVKDAKELGKAIETAATKLLGKENVFMYSIHTGVKPGTGFTTPEKAGIKRALEDIGTKARPEDIVLMFFAGHGEMQGADGKLFTFLTADASKLNPIGISTKELQDWLSYQGPHKMLANKTILIFDACNSGQATTELLALARNDDNTDRIRQVEDLKDKSGMFILAGSAPNQAAYELPQYQQGMLTYSLLSVLKSNPGILDDQQFLNVQKWFLESEQKLKEEVESKGLKQDAKPFGTANIRIGIVDKEVRESIVLANERPAVFCESILENNLMNDILKLRDLVSKEFTSISVRGADKAVVLSPMSSEQMNRLNIFYSVKDDSVTARIGLIKGNETLLLKDLTSNRSDLDRLVKEICEEVVKHAK